MAMLLSSVITPNPATEHRENIRAGAGSTAQELRASHHNQMPPRMGAPQPDVQPQMCSAGSAQIHHYPVMGAARALVALSLHQSTAHTAQSHPAHHDHCRKAKETSPPSTPLATPGPRAPLYHHSEQSCLQIRTRQPPVTQFRFSFFSHIFLRGQKDTDIASGPWRCINSSAWEHHSWCCRASTERAMLLAPASRWGPP